MEIYAPKASELPNICLAQFAALIVKSNHLFSKVLDIKDTDALRRLFTSLEINPYWGTHYRFDAPSKPISKSLGQSSIDILLLNTFVLFLVSYGKYSSRSTLSTEV
jgi:hypothetical protein